MKDKLLITTRNKIIYWDNGPHTIMELDTPNGRGDYFYGITWDTENIYIARRMTKCAKILVFGKGLSYKGMLSIDIKIEDVHQIYWWNKLYITNTNMENIVVWDGKESNKISWRKPNEPHLHLNSIWCDGKNFYVVEHRKKEMPKFIRIFDLDFKPIGEIEVDNKFAENGIHNIYIENGILFTCATDAIIRKDLMSGNYYPVVVGGAGNRYMRGFARTPEHFFVGMSEIKPRDRRWQGNSQIAIFNNDFELEELLHLENTGNIHGIRVISSDLSHNNVSCPI